MIEDLREVVVLEQDLKDQEQLEVKEVVHLQMINMRQDLKDRSLHLECLVQVDYQRLHKNKEQELLKDLKMMTA